MLCRQRSSTLYNTIEEMKKILTILLVLFSLVSFGQAGADDRYKVTTDELYIKGLSGEGIQPIGINSSNKVVRDTNQVNKSDSTSIYVTPYQVRGLVSSDDTFLDNIILRGDNTSNKIQSGVNIYNTDDGRLGINVLQPASELDVHGTISKDSIALLLDFLKSGNLGTLGTLLIGKGISTTPEFSNTLDSIIKYGYTPTFTDGNQLVTKSYVDALSSAASIKLSVDYATTGNITTLEGALTIDGTEVSAGQRVLVKDQTDSTENGVYIVSLTSWTRSSDFDTWSELYRSYVLVLNGTVNAGRSYVSNVAETGTLETDDIIFNLFNTPTNVIGGDALLLSGYTLDVKTDNSTIEVSSDQLRVKDSGITNAKLGTGIDALKIGDGSIGNIEFQYLNNLTGNIQIQLNGKADTSQYYTRTYLDAALADVATNIDTTMFYSRTYLDTKFALYIPLTSVKNDAYSRSSWNGSSSTIPTRDAVSDIIATLIDTVGVSYNVITPRIYFKTTDDVTKYSTDIPLATTVYNGLLSNTQKAELDSLVISDLAYNATTWNNSVKVPTQNAVRDQFENIDTDLGYPYSSIIYSYRARTFMLSDNQYLNVDFLTLPLASLNFSGLMSSEDKAKLDDYSGINSYSNTITISTSDTSIIFETPMQNSNYYLDVEAWYIDTVGGKIVNINNGIYNFTKSQVGFSCSFNQPNGYLKFLAIDSLFFNSSQTLRPVSQILSIDSLMDASLGWDAVLTITRDIDTLTISNLYDSSEGQIAVIQNSTGGYGIGQIACEGLTTKYYNQLPPTDDMINSSANEHTIISYKRIRNYLYITYGDF